MNGAGSISPFKNFTASLLRTYSTVFWSQEKWFGVLLLCVSFFNPAAGLAGLFSAVLALLIARFVTLPEANTATGLYSFNALMVGIGMGTFYETGWVFWAILAAAVLLTVMISVALGSWLGKYGLPFLSSPFVLMFWLILLAGSNFTHLGLSQRNVYWINEMYTAGGKNLLSFFNGIENVPLPGFAKIYFRSLSAIFFQSNLLCGMLIATGLLCFSRIAFLLSVIGFSAAFGFGILTGTPGIETAYYLLGANYMMTAIAIGAFFCVPSVHSVLWALWSVPLIALLAAGVSKITGVFLLPVFSLPFCIVVPALLYFFMHRTKTGKINLVSYQHYSPEKNLYMFLSNSERLKDLSYFRFKLPFLGEWYVSQGYEGDITHKGEWSKALDFVILDDEMKTYSGNGSSCTDYYCYGKPVLAPADGIVEEVVDDTEDNAIGEINMAHNWGNTIVIRHLPGLYTQLSHLRPGSAKFKKGEFVRQGDTIAQCGNSGRSPEPHLHFQVQAYPQVGARTIAYPFNCFVVHERKKIRINNFTTPAEGEQVSNITIDTLLQQAFAFQPGLTFRFNTITGGKNSSETWDVATDAWNRTCVYSRETKSTAYFINNGTWFYFTSYYGDEDALLYYFFLSCYKVPLFCYEEIKTTDRFPLYLFAPGPVKWLQDFIAPFHVFISRLFTLSCTITEDPFGDSKIKLHSETGSRNFGRYKKQTRANIEVEKGKIRRFTFSNGNKNVEALCAED